MPAWRDAAATLVCALHWLFVAFMVVAPFTSSRPALVLHAIVTPFLWVHWALNDDTCALTLLEKRLRGVDDGDSFFHAVVSPVYKIRDGDVRALCWAASALLWAVTLTKVGWADVLAELGWRRRGVDDGAAALTS
jgi:hypothetical protein